MTSKNDSSDLAKAREQVQIQLEVDRYEKLAADGDYASITINRRRYYIRREVLPEVIAWSKESATKESNSGVSGGILLRYADFVIDMKYNRQREDMTYTIVKDRNGATDVE